MRQFHIGTIVNSEHQYREMKASFVAAGFTEERCRYSVFDNSLRNEHEPYGVFNKLQEITTEPYIILCHQDVRADRGQGFDDLVARLEELERLDPKWAIAGNAGCDCRHRVVRHIHDRWGTDSDAAQPIKVVSLDENFLVIKRAAGLNCAHGLSGFHLYATYLCLDAERRGYGSYVVGFTVSHLGVGHLDEAFYNLEHKVEKTFGRHYYFRFVRTPCSAIVLSRFALLRRVFQSPRLRIGVVRRLAARR